VQNEKRVALGGGAFRANTFAGRTAGGNVGKHSANLFLSMDVGFGG